MKSKTIKTVGELRKWMTDLDDDVILYRVQNAVYIKGESRWMIVEGINFDQKRVESNDGMSTIIERPTKKHADAKLGVIL